MSTSVELRILWPSVPIDFTAAALLEPFAETSPLTLTLPVAIRFVAVTFNCGSTLRFVVHSPLANVDDTPSEEDYLDCIFSLVEGCKLE